MDVLEIKRHAASEDYSLLHIQRRLLEVLAMLTKNMPKGSNFVKMSYTLRSNWLTCLIHLIDRHEFHLEQCKFDSRNQPQASDEVIDVILRHRMMLLASLKASIDLLQNITFQGQLLRKVVSVFTRTYIRTTILKVRLVGLVNELIRSEDIAYEKLETEKIKKKEAIRRASLLARRKFMGGKGRRREGESKSKLTLAQHVLIKNRTESSGSESSSKFPDDDSSSRHSISSMRSESSGAYVIYGWENEVQKLMAATREMQQDEKWDEFVTKNPTLFNGDFFSGECEEREYLPSRDAKDHDKWLVTLIGHCGHYCVFLEQLITLTLEMSVPVDQIDKNVDKVAWGAIPNFQRLLRLFCHVIMRVQQFDPSEKKIADKTENGVPADIAHEEKRRVSEEPSEPGPSLYEERRLQVQKSPQIVKAVKDCSVTLLENSDSNVFNLFLHALFSRTSVHNRAAVRRSLKWLSTWLERIPKINVNLLRTGDLDDTTTPVKNRDRGGSGGFFNRMLRRTDSMVHVKLMPKMIDYKYMTSGLRSLIDDVHHLTLEMTFDFLYDEMPRFVRGKVRTRMIRNLVLNDGIFMKLFLYWNPSIRGLFHHLLVYRCFLHETRLELPLRSDAFFLGLAKFSKIGSPKESEKPRRSWIRKLNEEICEMYDARFDPVMRMVKGPLGKKMSLTDAGEQLPYLTKSIEEYTSVLAGYYKRAVVYKDKGGSIAPKLCTVKDYLQSKMNADSKDKKRMIDLANASAMWR